MELEVIALAFSALSVFVAALSLGWNIYRDIIVKPRMKVRFSVSALYHPTFIESTKLSIEATNLGPGKIKVKSIQTKRTSLLEWMLRKEKFAFVMHDFEDPMSSKLPADLDVGDTIKLFLPYTRESLLSSPYTRVGLLDSFGRIHWAPPKQVTEAKRTYMKDFGVDS